MWLHESASYFARLPVRRGHDDRHCRFDYVCCGGAIAGTAVAICLVVTPKECTVSSKSTALDDDVYELSPSELGDSLEEWRSAATYTLDVPVRCPYCDERIHSLHIVGLTRSQVAFTSTLPRKGRVATCPECDRILPAELAGLM